MIKVATVSFYVIDESDEEEVSCANEVLMDILNHEYVADGMVIAELVTEDRYKLHRQFN